MNDVRRPGARARSSRRRIAKATVTAIGDDKHVGNAAVGVGVNVGVGVGVDVSVWVGVGVGVDVSVGVGVGVDGT